MPSVASITESDLTPRKLKTAVICLAGQISGSSMPALIALTLVMLPMTGEFGWTRTQFSYGMSAIMWLSALSGPVLGRLVDRWGVRLVVLSGPAVLGLAMLALSRTHHIWQFYLYYSLLGIFAPATAIGYGKVIGVTFTRNRGKAFAVLMALLAMATSVTPLIGNLLLTRMGWRGSFSVLVF